MDKEDKNKNYSVMIQPNESLPVKSTAIVKYSAFQTPANFARLQCNTDLNSPPSNWLSNSADSYGLQHVLSQSTGFSSFRMAHMFPDCVGEVDVVSDAENIKNLLKLPYSRGPVSMMVHRIENTLLIDDFDIHKHLLRTAETEWDWLRKFFFDNIQKALNEKDLELYRRSKSRNILQQRSLISKFLYHSLVEPKKDEEETKNNEDSTPSSTPLTLPGPALPEPNIEEEIPDPTTKHKYNRNVVWTFEDIQMLIGTDMPIFGGSTHPCISLRLRDMSKSISVLTGIDYWLDNLMSNVPEVVMCYHLNGIVQKYEFIKTEDLPYLEDSKFSPKLIRDIAQNILSFLKSNATKAGHTYWLFKGRNDDVVKLYDLTSLCSGVLDEKGQNPFTVPVAMLLYRVARNMKHTQQDGAVQTGTIRMLLKNCIELLNKEKYPQIVTSSHYMLSDLYIPAHTNPNEPVFNENHDSDSSNYEDDDDSSLQNSGNDAIKQLRLSEPYDQDNSEPFRYKIPTPVIGSIFERCFMALQHISAGLNCLQYFSSASTKCKEDGENAEKKKKLEEEENLNMAHPFEPIPMPYDTLNSNANEGKSKKKRRNKAEKKKKSTTEVETESPKALIPKPKAEAMPTWQEPDRSDDASWNAHLKTLLYEKACLVYAILAEQEFMLENYGSSLRYIKILVKCQKVLKKLHFSSQHVQESCLLGRAGDCCCMIDKHWSQVEEYRKQYNQTSDIQTGMDNEIAKDCQEEDSEQYENWDGLLPETIDNNEQLLQISCQCYERALASEPGAEKTNLLRRLGNVHNELGTLYMNQACTEFNNGNTDIQRLISKSSYNLETGIRKFESIDDKPNLALLYSNMGRLMRLCAHVHSSNTSDTLSEMVGQEKIFYNKALAYYQKARQVLLNRNTNPEIWDAITWELSTASYNMATLLQDYPTVDSRTSKELEQEVVEMLHKALEYCDMETPTYRQPIYQFRGAKIHHRLASLYHNSFRNITGADSRKKSTVTLCKLHYERATSILFALEDSVEYLSVQLEYIALYQLLFQNAPTVSLKYKNLNISLKLILDTLPMIIIMNEKQVHPNKKNDPKASTKKSKSKKKKDQEKLKNGEIIVDRSKTDTDNKKQVEEAEKDEALDTEILKLLNITESQLQYILLNLTKLFIKPIKGVTAEHCSTYGSTYKKLYGLTLRTPTNSSISLGLHLERVMIEIKKEIDRIPELNF